MDKYEFIKRLEAALSGLSDEEKNSAVSYYKELFEDAGSDKVQELIDNLGSPEEIAESIKRESGTVAVQVQPENTSEPHNTDGSDLSGEETDNSGVRVEKRRDSLTIVLFLLVAIFTSPIWMSIAAVVLAVIFSILCVGIVLIVVFGIIGIAGIISGLSTLFAAPPVGIVFLGLGLIFTSLTLICSPFIFKGTVALCRWTINCIVSFFHSIIYKKEAAV